MLCGQGWTFRHGGGEVGPRPPRSGPGGDGGAHVPFTTLPGGGGVLWEQASGPPPCRAGLGRFQDAAGCEAALCREPLRTVNRANITRRIHKEERKKRAKGEVV